jgi:excisionase family DNA binding protein
LFHHNSQTLSLVGLAVLFLLLTHQNLTATYYIRGMADVLISISEAARLLGVHPNTLKAWEVKGKLKSIRTLGGHRRYRVSEIEAMQDQNNFNN